MTRLPVSAAVAASLNKAFDIVAVTDETGTVIGHFAPIATREELFRRHFLATVDPAVVGQPLDPNAKRYTTAEVKALLRSLGT